MNQLNNEAARAEQQVVADVSVQLAALREMTVGELCVRYREVFGEPTRSRNKDYLRKKIAWRIQELAHGGLSERALARIAELSPSAPVRWRMNTVQRAAQAAALGLGAQPERDPFLPVPGTLLTREYRGVTHHVTVLEDGFEHGGVRYESLSKVARVITGTSWNGYLFFRLKTRAKGHAAGGDA